jgi:ADP-heptose:LPS heptosyltransferase
MPNRYLVIAPQGLGDSLEVTPLAAALRGHDGDARIDVVVLRASARELFLGLPEIVDEVIYLPYWERGSISFLRALMAKRWRKRYDAVFLAYPAARKQYVLLARAFPASSVYLHRYGAASGAEERFFRVVEIRPVHNVLRNMDLLRAAGINAPRPVAYTVPASWRAREERNDRLVMLHVGSIAHDGLESRRWPLRYFASVASALADRGYDVRAVMGPSEVAETEKLRELEPRVSVIEGRLGDIARALSVAALTIANDNGIAHLSAGVRTPTISLFGPTPLEHSPYGPESLPLRPSNCSPCFDVRLLNTDCARKIDFECLRKDLTPTIVLTAADKVLAMSGRTYGRDITASLPDAGVES